MTLLLGSLLIFVLPIASAQARYSTVCGAGDHEVRYYFWNGTSDIAGTGEKQAVPDGMKLWSQVADVTFTESSLFTSDATIKWATGDHGDGTPFYPGAPDHTFPQCWPSNAGQIHFNDYTTYTTAPSTTLNPYDLVTVAAHEVGHILGLADTGVSRELMGSHDLPQRYLAWEDIRGVQALYGRRNGVYHLRNSNTAGPSENSFLFQNPGDRPVAGDWNGDGTETIGIWRNSNGNFFLRDGNPFGTNYQFQYGRSGDRPVVGDWDGNGTTTAGIYRPSQGYFYLDNTNTLSSSEYWFPFGTTEDLPVAGDWNGDGRDTIGHYRPSNSTFYLRNTNFSGSADLILPFGNSGDFPVVGDWNGDGIDTIGVYRPSAGTVHLKNTNNADGTADSIFQYGKDTTVGAEVVARPLPVAGDWDSNGTSTIGLYQN